MRVLSFRRKSAWAVVAMAVLLSLTGCAGMSSDLYNATPVPSTSLPPPLYVTYVNHVHLAKDYLPYDSKSLQLLDESGAQNLLVTLEALRSILDKFGVKATWNPVYGVSRGLCSFEGADHIFRRLVDSNHEVGVHFHGTQDFGRAVQSLRRDCGISPTNISGLLTHANPVNAVRRSVMQGISVSPITFSSSGLVNDCPAILPRGNTMHSETGNWMYSWKPDYQQGELCRNDSTSDFTFVDHGDMSWTGLAGNQQRDLFSEADFAALKQEFDAALAFVERERPGRVGSWAFVTHPHEFMRGQEGGYGPDPQTLGLFEAFLSYVKQKEMAGRVEFTTISGIAGLQSN